MEVVEASSVLQGFEATGQPRFGKARQDDRHGKTTGKRSSAINTIVNSSVPVPKCFCCDMPHPIEKCERFKIIGVVERANLVKTNRSCFNCLRVGHRSKDCKKEPCGEGSCKGRHHRLLHGALRIFDSNISQKASSVAINCIGRPWQQFAEKSDCVLLNIVQDIVKYQNREVRTFALLDRATEASLIDRWTIKKLKAPSRPTDLQLSTFLGQVPESELSLVSFELVSTDRSASLMVKEAVVVPKLDTSYRKIDWPSVKARWQHLKSIELPPIDTESLGVLIGMDIPEAHDYSAIVKPAPGRKGPTAIKSPFGWTVGGFVPNHMATRQVNCIRSFSQAKEDLDAQVAKWWEIESVGIFSEQSPVGPGDSLAIKTLETSLVRRGDRFEIGLPWKDSEVRLPNNRNEALRRFYALERRLSRGTSAFAELYSNAIEAYEKAGHARRVDQLEIDQDEMERRIWYLPHHGVTHPAKPGKVRIVFDASASFQGVSLNDVLLKGPDLTSNLATILLRFRIGPIAVSSDIEKMFLQVGVKSEDQKSLRFIWRRSRTDTFPSTYQMTVQVFGAVSSPTSCNFVLQQLAKENREQYGEVAGKVKSRFYVDNYLDSFDCIESAEKGCRDMSSLLMKGGFRLTQWTASST